jgi:hypothetical protein
MMKNLKDPYMGKTSDIEESKLDPLDVSGH